MKGGLGRRGSASLEFAIAVPVVLMMMAYVFDYSSLVQARAKLVGGLNNAAQYAVLKGNAVTGTTLVDVATKSSFLTGATASVQGPACFCTEYNPTRLVAATCAAVCPTTGVVAMTYVTISGTYNFVPMLPGMSRVVSTTLSETVSVMLK